MGSAVALLRATRPRQWVKNLLVVAVPFAAGRLLESDVLARTAVAFVAFVCASSCIYLLNDVIDRDADRQHPTKRARPIASGAVSPAVATIAAALLAVVALGLAFALGVPMGLTVVAYLGLQLLYVGILKAVAVIELALVASGFVLRAIAGGAASDIPISQWFLLAAGFGSLFVVAGKRYSEFISVDGVETGRTRAVLTEYSAEFLRFVWTMAGSVVVVVYGLWIAAVPKDSDVIAQATLVPFVLAMLIYARAIDRGRAGEPEEVALRDPWLIAMAVLWAALMAWAI